MKLTRITSAALLATGAVMFGVAHAQSGGVMIPLPTVRGGPVPAEQQPPPPTPPATEDQSQATITDGSVLQSPQVLQPRPGRRTPPSVERPTVAQAPETCKATDDSGMMGCPG